jgi:hypothetical protein
VRPDHAPDFNVGQNTSYPVTIQAVFLLFFLTEQFPLAEPGKRGKAAGQFRERKPIVLNGIAEATRG